MTNTREILFIADAFSTLDHANDSTLHLARTAIREFGIRCFWAEPSDVFLENSRLCVRVRGELISDKSNEKNPEKMFTALTRKMHLSDFHSVHWRKDPPVDYCTYQLWSLLESTPGTSNLVNPPSGLLEWNEKFSPLHFQDWAITSFVASEMSEFERFFSENLGKKLIVKPGSDAASRGVQILPKEWPEARKVIENLQASSGRWLIVQEFDDSVKLSGETRAFFLAGKIRASIKKMPKPAGSGIMNLDSATDRPTIELCSLTNEQSKRAETVAARLSESGIYLASIDFIGDRILEINVTSVGLLKWIDDQRLEKEKKLAQLYWELLQ